MAATVSRERLSRRTLARRRSGVKVKYLVGRDSASVGGVFFNTWSRFLVLHGACRTSRFALGDPLLKKLRLARFRVSFAENVAFSVMERAFEGRTAALAFIENSYNA